MKVKEIIKQLDDLDLKHSDDHTWAHGVLFPEIKKLLDKESNVEKEFEILLKEFHRADTFNAGEHYYGHLDRHLYIVHYRKGDRTYISTHTSSSLGVEHGSMLISKETALNLCKDWDNNHKKISKSLKKIKEKSK